MKNQKGFSLIELLIVVAIILIIAAIAIPSLMRARIAANESAMVGDMRTVISANATFQSAAGGYAQTLTCLSAPLTCAPAAGSVLMLDSVIALARTKNGYGRAYVVPVTDSATGLGLAYIYSGSPQVTGRTGNKGFAAADDGLICWEPNGGVPVPIPGPCANVLGTLGS